MYSLQHEYYMTPENDAKDRPGGAIRTCGTVVLLEYGIVNQAIHGRDYTDVIWKRGIRGMSVKLRLEDFEIDSACNAPPLGVVHPRGLPEYETVSDLLRLCDEEEARRRRAAGPGLWVAWGAELVSETYYAEGALRETVARKRGGRVAYDKTRLDNTSVSELVAREALEVLDMSTHHEADRLRTTEDPAELEEIGQLARLAAAEGIEAIRWLSRHMARAVWIYAIIAVDRSAVDERWRRVASSPALSHDGVCRTLRAIGAECDPPHVPAWLP